MALDDEAGLFFSQIERDNRPVRFLNLAHIGYVFVPLSRRPERQNLVSPLRYLEES